MFTVYEIDYHSKCHKVGEFDDLKSAKKAARASLKKTGNEFPVFIDNKDNVTVWVSAQ